MEAQSHLLAVASIRIVLSTAAKIRTASIVPNVTILPKTTVGNAPARARTETSRRRSVDAAANVAVLTVAAVRDAAGLIVAAASKASAASVWSRSRYKLPWGRTWEAATHRGAPATLANNLQNKNCLKVPILPLLLIFIIDISPLAESWRRSRILSTERCGEEALSRLGSSKRARIGWTCSCHLIIFHLLSYSKKTNTGTALLILTKMTNTNTWHCSSCPYKYHKYRTNTKMSIWQWLSSYRCLSRQAP